MLRYATIGSKISNMLENASQSIACYFHTFHRGCVASQRVAGPYRDADGGDPISHVDFFL